MSRLVTLSGISALGKHHNLPKVVIIITILIYLDILILILLNTRPFLHHIFFKKELSRAIEGDVK
jgi:hypothetical protein